MIKGRFTPTQRDTGARFGKPSVLGDNFPTPNPNREYTAEWAYLLSVISGWAYAEGQILADELYFHKLPNCEVVQISVEDKALLIEATAFVIIDKATKSAVLAFRGTVPDSLINWLTDAESAKYRFGDGFVHSGFFANVEAVWADIVSVLDEPLKQGEIEDLYVTGHSLGAAMATLAGAKIFENLTAKDIAWWDRVRGIYAFASPMVGDAAFTSEFQGKFGKLLHRFTYDQDVVPCLPPLSVDPGFRHFGQRRSARTREDTWELGGEDRHANLLDLGFVAESFITRRIAALKALGDVLFPFSLDDHSPRGYMDVSRNSIAPSDRRDDTRRVGRPTSPLRRLVRSLADAMERTGDRVEIIANGVLPLRSLLASKPASRPEPKLIPPSTSAS